MFYNISEIFKSIHGEGIMCGTPMLFVRFAGCNRTCTFCDTDHRTKTKMTFEDIRNALDELDPNKRLPVCFTGGEPLRQVSREWVEILHGRFLILETNGDFAIPHWLKDRCYHITVSPKGSIANNGSAYMADELRIVWPHPVFRTDVDMLATEFEDTNENTAGVDIVISPQWGKDGIVPENVDAAVSACISLRERDIRATLSLQGHKIWRIK